MKHLTAQPAKQQATYLKAVPSGTSDHRDVIQRPTWVPPEWKPCRPGADDHKQFKSFGTPA